MGQKLKNMTAYQVYLFFGILFSFFLFLGACAEKQSQSGKGNDTEAYTGDLYIIDIHAHFNPTDEDENNEYLEKLVAIAKAEGVSKIALGVHANHVIDQPPVYSKEHDEWVLAAVEKYPNIIIPFLNGFDPADADAPVYVEEQLKTGKWKAIGELDLRNKIKKTTTPMNSTIMMQIYKLAATYDVPVLIHYDSCYETTCANGNAEYENVLKENSDTAFISAHHCLEDLMREYENLYCEYEIGISQLPSEDILDRVLIGSDVQKDLTAMGTEGKPMDYATAIRTLREKLETLDAEDAANLAHGHAEELLHLEPTEEETTSTGNGNPSWVPTSSTGAWKNNLQLATSQDGLTFTAGDILLEHGGVPNLLLTSSGKIIAVYQYFSFDDEDMFDIIAYSISDDDGKTWTDPELLIIEGLPEPTTGVQGHVFVTHAVDPTLVELSDGSLRLYFTYQEVGEEWAHPASAINANGDITGTFTYEEASGLATEEEAVLLDPAVVYFDGVWHYYTWNVAQVGMGGATPASFNDYNNYHGTSEDGLTFTLQDPVSLDMSFLGVVIPFNDGLRFYGTGKGGVVSAYSDDGFTWEMDDGTRIQGVDPGVVQLSDGTYVMVYTSMNFN